MATDREVANFALGHLGEDEIDATEWATPTGKAAKTAKLWQATSRKRTLRLANWTCMTTRATLTVDGTAPDWGYAYRYALPADFLRLVSMFNVTAYDEWEVEDGFILINAISDDLSIKYVKDIADDTEYDKFDDDLVEALALAWAFDMCMTLTQSQSRKKELREDFADALLLAKNVDTSGASARRWASGSWTIGR